MSGSDTKTLDSILAELKAWALNPKVTIITAKEPLESRRRREQEERLNPPDPNSPIFVDYIGLLHPPRKPN